MKPPLTVTLDREKLNHPVHVKEEKSTKERRDKEMRKVRNNEGFTLAELLIVVAIIAVLVAVSIPIFTSQLEKSREATDTANLRAAKAAATVLLLDGTDESGAAYDYTTAKTLYFNTNTGILGAGSDANTCGKGTTAPGNKSGTVLFTDGTNEYKPENGVSQNYIQVIIESDAATPVQVKFVASAS